MQVRRGLDKAEIYSIALSPNVQWLAVSSDKGTVHIFSLRVRVAGVDSSNEQRTLEGPRMDHQNSSSSIDPLIQANTGSNASSSLSFMRGTHATLLCTHSCLICSLSHYWKLCHYKNLLLLLSCLDEVHISAIPVELSIRKLV